MTPQSLAVSASAIGRDRGLTCRYKWNDVKRRFEWQFFRRGTYLCATADPSKVIKKMESLL